jgi:predicted RNase H-like HicB family nuclease
VVCGARRRPLHRQPDSHSMILAYLLRTSKQRHERFSQIGRILKPISCVESKRGGRRIPAASTTSLMETRYVVSLKKTDEGYSVWVPGLPGCWSQGSSEEEALDNIRDAIREYVSVARELASEGEVREVALTV